MKIKPIEKIMVLLAACTMLLIVLSFIQFYLVSNTFRLTRDNYFKEVISEIKKLSKEETISALNLKRLTGTLTLIDLYKENKLTREDFIRRFKEDIQKNKSTGDKKMNALLNRNLLLKGMHYRLQYDKITLEWNGMKDTILSPSAAPIIFIGEYFSNDNTRRVNGLSDGVKISTSGVTGEKIINKGNYKLEFKESEYIDISSWQKQVIKRMTTVFVLAVSLIIAVVLLFYIILRAMFKQKKIAEMKTDFANNITHELKTPLSSVALIIKSLKRKDIYDNYEVVTELLESLDRQNMKIQHIVDSVLENAMEGNFEVLLTQTNITVYLKIFSKDLVIPNHQLLIDIEDQKQLLYTNTSVLGKVLNPLLENAVKYSGIGTKIKLKAYKNNGNYLIEIIDQGPGITAEYQPYIFDKFYRVPEHNKHTVKGLGLGLYLSKTAITQLGGSISLKSKPGNGCTFIIKLPVHEN